MVFYTSVWACLLIGLILAFHALSVFLRGILCKIFSYVNIALHIALVPLLLYIGAELSELVLIFFASTLFRVALIALDARISAKRSACDGGEGES